MTQVDVPWGSEALAVSLPSHWTLQQVAEPTVAAAPVDWREHMASAIHKPATGPGLGELLRASRAGKVVIVVEDLTRHSPLGEILDIVLREVHHAGLTDSQLEIFIAAGMHPACRPGDIRAKLGPAAEGIAWRWNPWGDAKQYVDLGKVGRMSVLIDRRVARADLRIVISSVSPHLQAGFGGGYKMFLPGSGHIRSIRALHRFGTSSGRGEQLVGTDAEKNPMRRAIDAAGAKVDANYGTTFSIQYLLDASDKPVGIAAGEPTTTHRMVTKLCANACGILAQAQADVLITNAHPRDHDLWQAFKAIPNTCWAARPNGVVICLARCPAGLNEMKQMAWPLNPAWTRRVVQWLGPENISSLLDRLVASLAGDSLWFIRLATQILKRNPIIMVSPKLVEDGAKFPGIYLCATVAEAIEIAEKLLGPGPQRVAIYPAGGATYPVMVG
jgi:nickel-dependent lactate racemase